MQLHIPQPCDESWDKMTPDTGGRHCAQCAKTVIDFTDMTAGQISVYMQLHTGSKLCGRFTTDQLEQNLPTAQEYVIRVLQAPIPFLRQIAALIIFALFIGTGSAIAQTPQRQPSKQVLQGAPLQPVSKVGRAVPQKEHHVVKGKVIPAPKPPKPPVVIMGDVASVPEPPKKIPDPQPDNTIMGGIRVPERVAYPVPPAPPQK